MNVLLRILGLTTLGQLAARLPPRQARTAAIALIVLSALIPIVGVLVGWMNMGQVFVLFWLENVVVWAFTIVRILTATQRKDGDGAESWWVRILNAAFFSFHFGMFTAVHGAFIFLGIGLYLTAEGETGKMVPAVRDWLGQSSFGWAATGMVLCQLFGLVVYWFGHGERHVTTVDRAVLAPYPRMLVLHVVIILALPLLIVLPRGGAAVIALVGLRTAVDLFLFRRERARADAVLAPRPPAASTATPYVG
jgi:hypothetical protein